MNMGERSEGFRDERPLFCTGLVYIFLPVARFLLDNFEIMTICREPNFTKGQ
jgi:hypothetical protein